MDIRGLEEDRACVVFKACVEIRKILDEARRACVSDPAFEFEPLLKEIIYQVGDHYGVKFLDSYDLDEVEPD